MANTLVALAPTLLPAGNFTSAGFVMPPTSDNEIVIVFNVQAPDINDSTKTLACQLTDVTAGQEVAGIAGWQGGVINPKTGTPFIPAFGVTRLQSLVGHTLQFNLVLAGTLNTGVTITTA